MKKCWKDSIWISAIICVSFYYFISLNLIYSTNNNKEGFPALTAESKQCNTKVKKIGYLKTHKCGSTTLQNMLLRFAIRNELNVVMDESSNHWLQPFERDMIGDTVWEKAGLEYDIFCIHTIWDQAEIARTLGEGAFYFTMLRNPVDQFISMWDDTHFGLMLGMTAEQFAWSDKSKLAQRIWGFYGRNQMIFDFGLTNEDMDNSSAINEKILEMDTNFDLVLIHERFEESMALLKDKLCWKTSDFVSLKLNVISKDKKSTLSAEARTALEDYLEADMRLYNHFKLKFHQQINTFTQNKIKSEIQSIREETSKAKNLCNITAERKDMLDGWYSKLSPVTKSNNTECRLLINQDNLDNVRYFQAKRAHARRPDLA